MSALLLDTHTAIWLVEGVQLKQSALKQILAAGSADGVYVSPITAWEIGLLATLKKSARFNQFNPNPSTWFAKLMAQPIIKPAPFNGDIAIAAYYLPEPLHRDPADRLLIATAQYMGIPIVTRDKAILTYGKSGHVKTLAC